MENNEKSYGLYGYIMPDECNSAPKLQDNFEARALIDRILADDEAAKDEFCTRLSRYVKHCVLAMHENLTDDELSDYMNEAWLEILSKIHLYDPNKNAEITTFLTPYIKHSGLKHLSWQNNTTVSRQSLRMKISKAEKYLSVMYNKTPNYIDIAEYLGIRASTVHSVMSISLSSYDDIYSDRTVISSEASDNSDVEIDTSDDHANPEDYMIAKENSDLLRKAIMSLPSIQQKVLIRKFCLYGYTACKEIDIATELDIPVQDIPSIVRKALDNLRYNRDLSVFKNNYDTVARVLGEKTISITPSNAAEKMMDLIESAEAEDLF